MPLYPMLCVSMSLHLLGHPRSNQCEQVLQQPGVVLSVQVSQGALLPEGGIWVLNTQTLWIHSET